MNKWKISFWICLIVLVFISLYSFFAISNKSVTVAFMKIGYLQTENDLRLVSRIYNGTDLSKNQIQSEILKDSIYESLDFRKDTFELQKVNLIFEKNRLMKIIPNH